MSFFFLKGNRFFFLIVVKIAFLFRPLFLLDRLVSSCDGFDLDVISMLGEEQERKSTREMKERERKNCRRRLFVNIVIANHRALDGEKKTRPRPLLTLSFFLSLLLLLLQQLDVRARVPRLRGRLRGPRRASPDL